MPGYGTAVNARLAAPGVVPVTSELTRLECRVKPLRQGDAELLAVFDAFFAEAATVVALTREVIDRAAGLRARYGAMTPDAASLRARRRHLPGSGGPGASVRLAPDSVSVVRCAAVAQGHWR